MTYRLAMRLTRRNKWISVFLFLGALLFAYTTILCSESRREAYWVCANTGSYQRQTTRLWFGYQFVGPLRIEPGAIHDWMLEHDKPVVHNWVFVAETGYNVFGRSMSHACGTTPEMYDFLPEYQVEYVRIADDKEIGALVATLTAGSTQQKADAVMAAIDQMMDGFVDKFH